MAFLLSLVLLCLLGPFLFAFWAPFRPFLDTIFTPDRFLWVGSGFVLCFALGLAARGAVLQFMEVAVHELIHTVVGMPFRGPPTVIAASNLGGVTQWTSSAAGCLVRLAPYCFPLLTALLLPLRLLGASRFSWLAPIIDFLIGGTLAFHYIALSVQLNPIQSDFADVGFPSAVAIALTSQLVWLVIIMGIVAGSFEAMGAYFLNAFGAIPHNYAIAWEVAQHFPGWARSTWAHLQSIGL